MKIKIGSGVFERFEGYRRAVVLVKGADNRGEDDSLTAKLRAAEADVRERSYLADYKEIPRIASWREVFRSMGINPNKYPPSVANLIKRTGKGTDLPFVNKLVCIFNVISLRHMVPCGGDDLSVVTGDLRLDVASGTEDYVPLGKPDVLEHPDEGEIIYFDDGNRDVFCRAWCWKNGDRSKITETTTDVAINVEGMPPVSLEDLKAIGDELAEMVREHCGGDVSVHILDDENDILEI
ncbi:MAG: phenylalanine--tRNA ligase beta subunit-related protein [Synergistota bacterium]|nr:phenylalanine--tRNA ligase beta subunit-related protein [Synergistota bacterium]